MCPICPLSISTTGHTCTWKLSTVGLNTFIPIFLVTAYFTFQICDTLSLRMIATDVIFQPHKIIIQIKVRRIQQPRSSYSKLTTTVVQNPSIMEMSTLSCV
jgi:hypothetical protein